MIIQVTGPVLHDMMCARDSVLQETVHVRELVNSNMCFVCVSCLSVCVCVCVFLFVLFGVIGTGCTRRVLLCMSGMFN